MIEDDGNLLTLVDFHFWSIPESNSEDEPWPSWTPKFDKTLYEIPLRSHTLALENAYCADDDTLLVIAQPTSAAHPDTLLLGGVLADIVGEVFPSFEEDEEQTLFNIVKLFEYGISKFGTSATFNKELLVTILTGFLDNEPLAVDSDRFISLLAMIEAVVGPAQWDAC